uniref:Uncharacterized protein n=1 Tax=Oryza sativa subsp. japonica TaxID=39947 RepID=Q69IJ9_ORYSJ|nr:hypothetical protein [Oryza sativa Japonica Group]BAD36721.1 hypothetical protein [Oryza sativa Japonica Group]BAD36727.1 hypothetical protein [Oryza sativa Japonica Group]
MKQTKASFQIPDEHMATLICHGPTCHTLSPLSFPSSPLPLYLVSTVGSSGGRQPAAGTTRARRGEGATGCCHLFEDLVSSSDHEGQNVSAHTGAEPWSSYRPLAPFILRVTGVDLR